LVAAAKGGIKEQNELRGWHGKLARKARNTIPYFAEFWLLLWSTLIWDFEDLHAREGTQKHVTPGKGTLNVPAFFPSLKKRA
jgi:hypothetical protein